MMYSSSTATQHADTGKKGNTVFILTISKVEKYIVEIVEICEPRSRFDTETHRVRILGRGIVRVSPSQLKPA